MGAGLGSSEKQVVHKMRFRVSAGPAVLGGSVQWAGLNSGSEDQRHPTSVELHNTPPVRC